MSEQAKTLKELAERIGWCACGPGTEEGTPERQANVEGAVLSVMRNYHLIPGADAVATEEDLLAVGYAYEFAHKAALDTNDYEAGLIAGARAALKAAGITACNEVGEVPNEVGYVQYVAHLDDGSTSHINVASGDRIYIVRADPSAPVDNDRGTVTGRDTSTAATRKADVSKSGAGIDRGEFVDGELPPADPPLPETLGWPDVIQGDNDEGEG